MSNEWEKIYVLAALEVDRKKMVERLFAARQAIIERFYDLEHKIDHHAESKRLDIALKNLNALEAESENW